MSLTTGQMLQNRYRIVALLGQGGMGAVYRAWDTRLDVPVALKELVPQPGLDAVTLAKLRGQFIQEAKVLARLRHPHLVNVTDYFEEGGKAYLVMEFMEGESLDERINREGALEEAQVRTWAEQLLGALAYCHAQGILHRDVKPQNVVITPEGEAVLVDFGLVKLWDPDDPRTRTAIRGAGTPEYAPPEQYSQHTGHTEPRSDIYGLGATLYHALTGQAPPAATDRMAYPQSFRPPRTLNGRISARMDGVIQRAMALACDDRWSSATAMAAALAKADTPVVSSGRPAPATPTRTAKLPGTGSGQPSWWQRVPVWGWVLGAVVAVVLLGLGLSALAGDGDATPTVVAEVTDPPATEEIVVEAPTSTPRLASTVTPEPTPTVAASGALAAGDTRTRESDGMTMVYVPAGEFEMGSTEYDDEQPIHTVALDAFWLDQTEVSVAQFRQFINTTDHETTAEELGSSLVYDGDSWEQVEGADWAHPQGPASQAEDDHPVVHVSWDDADAYCAWAGGRLPTEAEWEYAARGPESLIYPWGNVFDGTRLNYCDQNCSLDWADEDVDDGYEFTAPVRSYPGGASWVKAYDLSGNVWEWVADWYDSEYYAQSPQENPTGPTSGGSRVLRGGSWFNNERYVRGANRNRNDPPGAYSYYGFRCVAVGAPGE